MARVGTGTGAPLPSVPSVKISSRRAGEGSECIVEYLQQHLALSLDFREEGGKLVL